MAAFVLQSPSGVAARHHLSHATAGLYPVAGQPSAQRAPCSPRSSPTALSWWPGVTCERQPRWPKARRLLGVFSCDSPWMKRGGAEPHQPMVSCKDYVAEAKLIATTETSEEWAKWLQLEYLFNKLVIHTELLFPSSPKSDLSETPNTHLSCEKETVKAFWQFIFIRSLYFCLHLVT